MHIVMVYLDATYVEFIGTFLTNTGTGAFRNQSIVPLHGKINSRMYITKDHIIFPTIKSVWGLHDY